MSKHSYIVGCTCDRCVREHARRAKQAASDPRNVVRARKPRAARVKQASRAEQRARYIDSGPGAWDDRE